MVAIQRIAAEQAAVFGNQQEQEAVNEAQQLAVQAVGGDPIVLRAGRRDAAAQFVVGRMPQEAVGQQGDALFDAVAQVIADASALLDRMGVVLFQQAFVGVAMPCGRRVRCSRR